MSRARLLTILVGSELLFLTIAWGAGEQWNWHWWQGAPLTLKGVALGLLLGLVAAALVIACAHSEQKWLARLRSNLIAVLESFRPLRIFDLVLVSAMAGLGEEAFFRGFMQMALEGPFGLNLALLCVTLVFGLFHFASISYVIYTMVVGLLFSLLTLLMDNIVPAMVAHFVLDAVAFLYGALVFRPRNSSP